MRLVPVVCLVAAFVLSIGGCKRSDDTPAGNQSAKNGADETAQLLDRGEKLVRQFSCASCHSIDGSKRAASTFAGMYGRNDGPLGKEHRDEAYLRRAIVSPSPTLADGSPSSMPAYGTMDDETLDAIVAFIRSLADQTVKSPEPDESDKSDD